MPRMPNAKPRAVRRIPLHRLAALAQSALAPLGWGCWTLALTLTLSAPCPTRAEQAAGASPVADGLQESAPRSSASSRSGAGTRVPTGASEPDGPSAARSDADRTNPSGSEPTRSPRWSKPPIDLQTLARESFAAGRPLVVMFTLRGCPWCDALRREHFNGLLATGAASGITALELDLTDSRPFAVRAPSGAPSGDSDPESVRADNARELGRRYRVRLAPTVLFIGPGGELADRLVGYGSPDFYGAYLEQRVAQARAALATR